jgi:hypothetical protein
VRLLASRPIWRTRVSLFVWLLPLDLSGMGDPASNYATAGIALRVSGALKPHHHEKVEIPSVGKAYVEVRKYLSFFFVIHDAYRKMYQIKSFIY